MLRRTEGRGDSFIEMRMKRKQQGFTLLEIMLVVSIIVIILGVAISKLGNTTAIAKTMRVQADVQAIKTQLQLYESMNGFYPTTEQGLQALVTQPDKDPRPARWYQLRIPGETSTFIAAPVSKIRAATTCILPGRIARLTRQTTIGAAVKLPKTLF